MYQKFKKFYVSPSPVKTSAVTAGEITLTSSSLSKNFKTIEEDGSTHKRKLNDAELPPITTDTATLTSGSVQSSKKGVTSARKSELSGATSPPVTNSDGNST